MDCDDLMFSEQDDVFFQKIDADLDFALALSLQEELIDESKQEVPQVEVKSKSKLLGIVDSEWELIDPNPDIHGLFLQFNTKYFYGKLEGVEVRWSPRMTLCAGVCCYEGRGGLCSVRLSLPLLKLRPRRDLVETLLHEMIHAYLFVTANNKDHDAHGPEFLKHMYRINKETGTRITVYHSFHNEVDQYRKHWWKCNGPCQNKRPFYGLVKRAMNRSPGPNDNWWSQHQATCGGTFVKIKEPEDYHKTSQKRKQSQVTETKETKSLADIKSFFKEESSKFSSGTSFNDSKRRKGEADICTIKNIFAKEDNIVSVFTGNPNFPPIASSMKEETHPIPFSGKGFTLGSTSSEQPRSFLSRIRKELGNPTPRYSPRNLPLETSKPSTSIKKSSILDASSSLPIIQKSSVNKSEKSKLIQSSLEKFITSPTRNLKNEGKPTMDAVEQNHETNICQVPCPVCAELFLTSEINTHLDKCLLTAG